MECDFSAMRSDRPWVIVSPTYAWRIPSILHAWLEKTTLSGSREIYFLMTCGGSIGNAEKYLKKLCSSKNMDFSGCFPLLMPENYIAMYPTPGREDALETIRLAEAHIDNAARLIKDGSLFMQRSFTQRTPVSPAENVQMCVRWVISIWMTGNRCGGKIVRIVWHVSAAVRKRQLSMGGIVWGCRGIFVRNRSNAGAIVSINKKWYSIYEVPSNIHIIISPDCSVSDLLCNPLFLIFYQRDIY